MDLLGGLFARLWLHDEPVQYSAAASQEDMDELWDEVLRIDPNLKVGKTTASDLKDADKFHAFLEHCTVRSHYFVSIKKCGKGDCEMCSPPSLSADEFASLHHFPHPEPDCTKQHYYKFSQVWGTKTTGKFRPSLQKGGLPADQSGPPPFQVKAE